MISHITKNNVLQLDISQSYSNDKEMILSKLIKLLSYRFQQFLGCLNMLTLLRFTETGHFKHLLTTSFAVRSFGNT